MPTKKTIGFLGGGNLTEAIIKGLLSSKKAAKGLLLASDCDSKRLAFLAERYEIKVLSKNYELVGNSDIIVLAVKPKDSIAALIEVRSELTGAKLLISAVAGLCTEAITGIVGSGAKSAPVIRAMPNTPAMVREAATALYAAAGATKGHIKAAHNLFGAVGKVVLVQDESLMDAITGLSGSGPAYVFTFIEALSEAGVSQGLPYDLAKALSVQTTLGAARLAKESDKELSELIRMVSSPGGTTIEGLKGLKLGGFSEAVKAAVAEATKRARELSIKGDD